MAHVINAAIAYAFVLRDNASAAITGVASLATAEAYVVDTPATTAAVTITENANGKYRATFTPTTADDWEIHLIYSSGGVTREFAQTYNVVASAPATVADVEVTVAGEWLEAAVPGSFTQGTAGYALGRLGVGSIAITAPTWNSSAFELVRGDDYKAVDGRAIDFTERDISLWPDLTDATVQLVVTRESSGGFTVDGTVEEATSYPKRVRFEINDSDTNGKPAPATYRFAVRATLDSGNIVTLATGSVRLVKPTEP